MGTATDLAAGRFGDAGAGFAAIVAGAGLAATLRGGGAMIFLAAFAAGVLLVAARTGATAVAARFVGADADLAAADLAAAGLAGAGLAGAGLAGSGLAGAGLAGAGLAGAGLDAVVAFGGDLVPIDGACLAAAFGVGVGRDAFEAGRAFFAETTVRAGFAGGAFLLNGVRVGFAAGFAFFCVGMSLGPLRPEITSGSPRDPAECRGIRARSGEHSVESSAPDQRRRPKRDRGLSSTSASKKSDMAPSSMPTSSSTARRS